MAVQFRLPDLGEGMTEGEVVRWLVKPGDRVVEDQAIAEVQTDKAVVEIPSPVEGVVLTIDVEEGQLVPVETVLLTFEESKSRPVPASSQDGPEHAAPAPLSESPNNEALAESEALYASSPAPVELGSTDNGTGRWTAASLSPQRHVLATPAVRRLARELGVPIATVRGSGPVGRVLAGDLHAARAGSVDVAAPDVQVSLRVPEPASTSSPRILEPLPAPEPEPVPKTDREASVLTPPTTPTRPATVAHDEPTSERLPLRGLRRRIAENMVLSVSTIPQVTSLVEIDASGLVATRRAVLPGVEAHGVKLSYLPFIIKAVVQALRLHPYVNASIDDATKEIVLHRHYHIGIATATEDGLLVPVLRHADHWSLWETAAEINRLAEGGRTRRLPLEELRGSTFTISNYGTVGGFYTTPIINPGEAGILGLGRIVERPWVVDGRVEPRSVLPLSFTADHRLIDGELAMRFLNTLTALLEEPRLLLVEMR